MACFLLGYIQIQVKYSKKFIKYNGKSVRGKQGKFGVVQNYVVHSYMELKEARSSTHDI